jgi:hypothetical protein
MSHRRIFILGFILLFLGFLSCFILAALAWQAYSSAIFSSIGHENSPGNQFQKLQCPIFMNLGRSATINVIFRNPTGDAIAYSMYLETDGFSIDSRTASHMLIPGGQLGEDSWTVTAVKDGAHAIRIEASSSKDIPTSSTPFYSRPTSFGGVCGILVISGPLSGPQILFLGLVSSLTGGALLVTWYSRRIKQRRNQP